MISMIACMDINGVIGKDNKMPWHLPADLEHFKNTTMGHPIVMGRKTFESIGYPLPGRKNIIITRDKDYKVNGCIVVDSLDKIKSICNSNNVFIIGGSEIYKQMMPYADKLYITEIDEHFEGDTFFPKIDNSEWRRVFKENHLKDNKNPYNYSFLIYERIKK